MSKPTAITSQPQEVDPWGEKTTPIAMPPPGNTYASETTGLKDTHHSSYMSS
jgi:hypothetical protein